MSWEGRGGYLRLSVGLGWGFLGIVVRDMGWFWLRGVVGVCVIVFDQDAQQTYSLTKKVYLCLSLSLHISLTRNYHHCRAKKTRQDKTKGRIGVRT